MKLFAIVGALAALSGCKKNGDRGDGSVEMEIRCDAPGGYCPCSTAVHADHRYLFCPDVVTWEEARDKCRSFGFELVKIESEAEQAFVWARAEETDGDYWIGLTDSETEGALGQRAAGLRRRRGRGGLRGAHPERGRALERSRLRDRLPRLCLRGARVNPMSPDP